MGESALRRAPAALARSPLLPIFLALVIHSGVLSHGLLWDDPVVLDRQLPALSPRGAFAPPPAIHQWTYAYYRPLATLSLLADRALYGSEPLGYHLTVWLLHAAATLAIFLLGDRLFSRRGAVLGASLFAVFPLAPECVGWIAGRADVLAGLFGALAIVVLLDRGGERAQEDGIWMLDRAAGPVAMGASAGGRRGVSSPPGSGAGPGFGLRVAIAALLFLAALLSKESAISLAPVLLAAVWLGGKGPRRLAAATTACGLSVIVYLSMRTALDPDAGLAAVSASAPGAALPGLLRTAAYFPVHLVFPIDSNLYRAAPPAHPIVPLTALVLLSVGAWLCVRALRSGRSARLVALVWIASACLTGAAAASWTLSRTPIANRYFYLPAGGWCLLLGDLFASAGRTGVASAVGSRRGREASSGREPPAVSRRKRIRSRRPIPPAAASTPSRPRTSAAGPIAGWLLVAVFSAATIVRTPVYANDRSFWSAVTSGDPTRGAAWIDLGNALAAQGDASAAEGAYRRALGLDLDATDRALATTDLGALLFTVGRLREAETILREGASLPGAGATESFNLGALLFQKGLARLREHDQAAARAAFREAVAQLETTVERDPYHVKAWFLLGQSSLNVGQREAARRAWKRTVELDGADGEMGSQAAAELARPD